MEMVHKKTEAGSLVIYIRFCLDMPCMEMVHKKTARKKISVRLVISRGKTLDETLVNGIFCFSN